MKLTVGGWLETVSYAVGCSMSVNSWLMGNALVKAAMEDGPTSSLLENWK